GHRASIDPKAATSRCTPKASLFFSKALEEFSPEGLVVARPGAFAADVFTEQLGDAVELGVEIVEQVQGDRFERHGQLGTAVFVFTVMADDEVLQPQQQLTGKRLAGQPLGLGDLVLQRAEDHHDVAEELPLVAVAVFMVIDQLVDLPRVMQKRAEKQ